MKLNIGCGKDLKEGYVNLDKFKFPGVDILADIEQGELPFPESSVDEIYCSHVLEHMHTFEDFIHVMNEFWRVLKNGGRCIIIVPHFTSALSHQSAHHLYFNTRDFELFTDKGQGDNFDYYPIKKWKHKSVRLYNMIFWGKWWFKPFHKFINWSINKMTRPYEMVFHGWFPMHEIHVEMIK